MHVCGGVVCEGRQAEGGRQAGGGEKNQSSVTVTDRGRDLHLSWEGWRGSHAKRKAGRQRQRRKKLNALKKPDS